MPVINVDGKIASLEVSVAVLRPLLSSKHFCVSPGNGQVVSEDDHSRIASNRSELTTRPPTQRLSVF
jgi:hypothetical protein